MISFKETKALKDYDSVSLAEMLREHFIQNYPIAQVEKLSDAIQVASYLHRYDVRRGNRGKLSNPPYIEHPLRVALRLVRFDMKNPDLIIAAILHDTVEDHPFEFADFVAVVGPQGVKSEELARKRALDFISTHFGYGVANIVDDVSNPIIPEGVTKEEKISQYQKHVERVINHSEDALLVKVSDFIDNAGSLHHHYNLGDKKVSYFLNRYASLIPLYTDAVDTVLHPSFNADAVLTRIEQVDAQFKKFEESLT